MAAAHREQLLHSLAADGDGKIELEKFRKLFRKWPKLILGNIWFSNNYILRCCLVICLSPILSVSLCFSCYPSSCSILLSLSPLLYFPSYLLLYLYSFLLLLSPILSCSLSFMISFGLSCSLLVLCAIFCYFFLSVALLFSGLLYITLPWSYSFALPQSSWFL